MSPEITPDGGGWTPPFVQPLLRALDRMEQRSAVRPEVQTSRAHMLLSERLGSAVNTPDATFSHGVLGLAADHTTLIDGFALMLPIRDGIAVAIRETSGDASRLVFDGEDHIWTFDAGGDEQATADGHEPWWVRLFVKSLRLAGTGGRQVDASVVSTVMSGCEQSYSAALGMSAFRTAQSVFPAERDETQLFADIASIVASVTGERHSSAYPIATDVAAMGHFVLVDVRSGRRMAFPTPAADPVGWGLIDTRKRFVAGKSLKGAKDDADVIVARLRKKSFPNLESLRDLEHKDLEAAEKIVGRHQRNLLRYLVRENQRVHRLVTAARRGDWQLFGALLGMAHASLSDELSATLVETDFVVEMVEEQTVAGMYGGRAVGFSGVAVVAGQPFVVPQFIDSAKAGLEERFGIVANAVLL